MIRILLGATALALSLITGVATAADQASLQWFGQGGVKINTTSGKVILIDPFINGNPGLPDEHKNLEEFENVDLILVTHAHGDHWGDTKEISDMTGAPVAVNADFGTTLRTLGVLPGDRIIRFNKSGPIAPLGDDITITMTHAEHSSEFAYTGPDGEETVHPAGEPAGYIVELEDGYTIWHMGDTGVFSDMEWIADYYQPDLILMPIGGHYTMDPVHAAYATNQFIERGTIIPVHYGIGPLTGTPKEYKAALGRTNVEVVVMQQGDTHTLP